MTTSPNSPHTGTWAAQPASPQRPPASQSNWTVGKVVGVCALAVLALVIIVGVTYMVSRQNFDAEQAAKPADTVPAQMDPATVATAPTTCGDDTIYALPTNGGDARVLKDGDWAYPEVDETTVGISVSYAPNGGAGNVIVTTKPGKGMDQVKITSAYVWNVAMSDKFKAKLGVTRFKPTAHKSSVLMKDTGLRPDSLVYVCTTTK